MKNKSTHFYMFLIFPLHLPDYPSFPLFNINVLTVSYYIKAVFMLFEINAAFHESDCVQKYFTFFRASLLEFTYQYGKLYL